MILIFFITPTNHFRDQACCFLKLCLYYRFYVIFIYLVFPFDLIFYEPIHPWRVTVIKCNQFVGNKIRKDIVVSLKIENCLLTVLLLNKLSQFTDLTGL